MFHKFMTSRDGNFAVLSALLALPLVAAIGLAVDYSGAVNDRNQLQNAADAAALATVKESRGDFSSAAHASLDAHARNVFFSNNDISAVQTTLTLDAETSSATVSATLERPLLFPIFGDSWTLNVSAKAQRLRSNLCIIALTTSGAGIATSGSSEIAAPNCLLHSNSPAANSFSQTGASVAKAKGFCAVGRSTGTFTPAVTTKCAAVSDPLSYLSFPSNTTGCTTSGMTLQATQTLQPGVHCGALTTKSGAVVTLAPGTHVIRNGVLSTEGASTLKGTDVTIVLQGTSYFDVKGTSSLTLSAPTSGNFAGVVIAQGPSGTTGLTSSIGGGGEVTITGSIYLPKQTLFLGGNGSLTIKIPVHPVVVKNMVAHGSSTTPLIAGFEMSTATSSNYHELIRLVH